MGVYSKMSEIMIDGIRAYQRFMETYTKYCEDMFSIMARSVKNSETKDVNFFNGFLSGYESAKNDYKQFMTAAEKKDAAEFYG